MKKPTSMTRFCLVCSAFLVCVSTALSQSRDTMPDTWSATDALGRALPRIAEAGEFKPNRTVGILYFNWQAGVVLWGEDPVLA